MNLSEEEKRALNVTFLLNHGKFSHDIAKEAFQSLLIQMKENYDSKNECTKIVIPYIGELYITYESDAEVYDEDTNKLKIEAQIKSEFIPNRELKRCIGDLVDGNITNIEKKIYRDIENTLRKAII